MDERTLNMPFVIILLAALALSLSPANRNSLKSFFLESLPGIDYYISEKATFEKQGRELHSLVLVVPPLRFSESELRRIAAYGERMNASLPFVILWSLNGSLDPGYVTKLASVLRHYHVRSRVYSTLTLAGSLAPLNGVEVWVRRDGKWVPLRGEGYGYGDGAWRCDEIYHGLVEVGDDAWWFYYEEGRASGCTRLKPLGGACDVHMIFEARFIGMGVGRALITFPGSEPALNCGGTCGSTNTLLRGSCNLTSVGHLLFASYLMTHTRKDPCPYYSYCGCLGSCNVPQIFISDIRAVRG